MRQAYHRGFLQAVERALLHDVFSASKPFSQVSDGPKTPVAAQIDKDVSWC